MKSPVAGKKELPIEGEANIYQIWPNDSNLIKARDGRDRGLSTEDININGSRGNTRLMRLQM